MYEIDLQFIRFSNGKRYQFPTEIVETLEFEESIVVRLASDPLSISQNIYGLDWQGNLLWMIPTPRTFDPRSSYVALFRKGSLVEVLNWDGHVLTLDPKEGTILTEAFYSGGSASRRTPPARHWL